MKKPIYWEKAKKFLSKDKAMFKLINSYDGHLITRNNFFYSLSRSIISQLTLFSQNLKKNVKER